MHPVESATDQIKDWERDFQGITFRLLFKFNLAKSKI